MSNLQAMRAVSEALLGQELAEAVAKAAASLEKQYGDETARGLLGSVDRGAFVALKGGTATRQQMVDAVTALTAAKAGLFRQQLFAGAVPQGIGGGAQGDVASKFNSRRAPGTKYRDSFGRLRVESDTEPMNSLPVKPPPTAEMAGKDAWGRRIRDDAFKSEQAKRIKRDRRRSTGQS